MSIGAEVLVPEATGNLKIPIEAGHHEQLFVDLGRLRQREEFARMDPAWHQIIPGAFRCRLGEDRGFDLEKTQAVEVAASGLHQPMPQDDVALQLGPPEIQHSVPQPELLGRQVFLLFSGDGNRRRRRRPHDLKIADVDLYVS
jgi:hypothetical protein